MDKIMDKICLQCGTRFTPKRRTKKFCSDACRVSHHLRGNRVDEDLRTIGSAIDRIALTARESPALVTETQLKHLARLWKQSYQLAEKLKTIIESEES